MAIRTHPHEVWVVLCQRSLSMLRKDLSPEVLTSVSASLWIETDGRMGPHDAAVREVNEWQVVIRQRAARGRKEAP